MKTWDGVWKVPFRFTMKGWFIVSKIFFSLLTCSICLSLIISDFLRHFSARGSASAGSLLCLTSLTLPNVPVPRVDKNLKSLRINFPVCFLLSLAFSSSSSSYACISNPTDSGIPLSFFLPLLESIWSFLFSSSFCCWRVRAYCCCINSCSFASSSSPPLTELGSSYCIYPPKIYSSLSSTGSSSSSNLCCCIKFYSL